VPEVVPPADSTVSEIELATVPVTVSVPLLVAAFAAFVPAITTSTRPPMSIFFICILLFAICCCVRRGSRRRARKNTEV